MKSSICLWTSIVVVIIAVEGCQRDKPADQSKASPPVGTVEQAVQQTVEGIKSPMDKARGVEGTLSQAADRTAEQASQTTP